MVFPDWLCPGGVILMGLFFQKHTVLGWRCSLGSKAAAYAAGIPYGHWFSSQLFLFQSCPLLVVWENQWKVLFWEREKRLRQGEQAPILWLIPPIPAISATGLEPVSQSRCPMWVAGTNMEAITIASQSLYWWETGIRRSNRKSNPSIPV